MTGKPTFAELFAGIGGFRLGLERAGWECKWSCEIDPFCRFIYTDNFGREPEYGDIRKIKEAPYVDMLCGGFPCQPFSVAGKQLGADDNRNLWPEMLRIIKIVRPVWVLGENVPGIGDYTDTICADLEAAGYEVLPLDIPACVFGAQHIRYRRWFLSHANGKHGKTGRIQEHSGKKSESPKIINRSCDSTKSQGREKNLWAIEPGLDRMADGIPYQLDRLKSLGNAVVPQVVEWIGKRIIEVMA